jgi:hypothetical protein
MPRHGARISDNYVGSAAIGIAQKCSPAAGTDSPAALLLPRRPSHLVPPVLSSLHFCSGSPARRSGSRWLGSQSATKGGVSLGLRAGSSRRTKPMGRQSAEHTPASSASLVVRAAGGRPSGIAGAGPRYPGAEYADRAGAGRWDGVDQGWAGPGLASPYTSCEPSGGPAGPGGVLVHE